MKKYLYEKNEIGYEVEDVVKFFRELEDFSSLNENGRKNLAEVLYYLVNKTNRVVTRLILSEYVPVSKGWCPGIDHYLKDFDEELDHQEMIKKLNKIKFYYTCKYNRNYFVLHPNYYITKIEENIEYIPLEYKEHKEKLKKVINFCDF